MNDVELDIYKANANQQLNQAVRTADGELFKSWATDLSKKFPNGGWRTINGAHVFVDGGKVVAGLDGFNGKVDDAFKESGKSESKSGKKETTTSRERYEGMELDDLVKLKKKKYSNMDISSPMSEDEKTLNSVIAGKFSEVNQKIMDRREAKRKAKEASKSKETDSKPPYHKDDKLNEFRDMAKNSKSESDFVSKIRAKKDVTPDVSGEFHEKYNPKGNLSPEKAAGALFKEVHNAADVDVTGNKPEKIPQNYAETHKNHTKLLNNLKSYAAEDGRGMNESYHIARNFATDLAEKSHRNEKTKEKYDKWLNGGGTLALREALADVGYDGNNLAQFNAFALLDTVSARSNSKSKPTPKTEQPKEIKPKGGKKIKEFDAKKFLTDVKDLNNAPLYNKRTFETDTNTVSKMADLASQVNEKMLSPEHKEQLLDLMDDLNIVSVHVGTRNAKLGAELEGKTARIADSKSLASGLKNVNKQMKLEQSDNYDSEKHGEILFGDDFIENAQNFLVSIGKDYAQKVTTEKQNYKLF